MSADPKQDLANLMSELHGVTLHGRPVREVMAERIIGAGWVQSNRHGRKLRAALDAAEAKVARVEALATSAPWVPIRTDRAEVTRHCRMVKADDITAALAEPERDEEGGR